ncbi:MAG: zinc ribbon domain-containing protein [Coriobacteriales bacterium]
MYCKNCKSQLDDDAIFCTECGTKVQDVPAVTTDETTTIDTATPLGKHSVPANDEVIAITSGETVVLENAGESLESKGAPEEAAAYQPQHTKQMPVTPEQQVVAAQPAGGTKKKRTGLVIAIVCVAVAALVGIGIFVYTQITAHQKSHTPVPVQVSFAFPNSQDAQPIGVPLVIRGTDLDGRAVDEQVLATPGGEDVELLAGEYTMSVAGSPASAGGVVYGVEGDAEQRLEVPVPGDDAGQSEPAQPVDFGFSVVPANEVSDAQIDDIKQWMQEYGVSADEIQSIGTAIVERRNAEVARIALEQEKQAALAANPSVIEPDGDPRTAQATRTAQLTGTVCVQYFEGMTDSGDVVYLQLPSDVRIANVNAVDYVDTSRIILPSSFSAYRDKVITISAPYSVRKTASIKEAQCSLVWANNPKLVREF